MKKTFILIHGAWYGAWCWEKITPLLLQLGHEVWAPDLSNNAGTTLKSLVSELSMHIESAQSPVILVGHSMAGILLSQLAEKMPEKIDSLVYLSAFIPTNRGCLLEEVEQLTEFGLSTEVILEASQQFIGLRGGDRTAHLLLNQCCKEDVEHVLRRLKAQIFQPFRAHVHLSVENFGRVPKYYIVCQQDLVVLPADQLKMAIRAHCKISYLEHADHAAFYSTPGALVNLLEIQMAHC